MKKRFRKVVRQGWYTVRLDRANLWNWNQQNQQTKEIGDDAHYRIIRKWCNDTFVKDTWEGRFINKSWWRDTSNSVVTKEFAFKNEKDKTFFMLKWM